MWRVKGILCWNFHFSCGKQYLQRICCGLAASVTGDTASWCFSCLGAILFVVLNKSRAKFSMLLLFWTNIIWLMTRSPQTYFACSSRVASACCGVHTMCIYEPPVDVHTVCICEQSCQCELPCPHRVYLWAESPVNVVVSTCCYVHTVCMCERNRQCVLRCPYHVYLWAPICHKSVTTQFFNIGKVRQKCYFCVEELATNPHCAILPAARHNTGYICNIKYCPPCDHQRRHSGPAWRQIGTKTIVGNIEERKNGD